MVRYDCTTLVTSAAVAGILYGGFDGSAPLEDLWGWSAVANKWFELPNKFIGDTARETPLARYNHCAASLSPGGMFVCGGVIGAANDMPVTGKEVTMWWDAEQQGWTDVNVSQRYTGQKAFNAEVTFASLTGIVDTVDMKRSKLYCPLQLSDSNVVRVPEESLFDWAGRLPDTAVLVGGRRLPHQTSNEVMQLMPLPSGWAWLPLPSLPNFGVYSHSACSMSGCVAVWGGCVTASEPAYFEDVNFGQRSRHQDILLYDVHRGRQWTRVKLKGQVPPNMHGASMAPVGNNQILIFGGTDGAWGVCQWCVVWGVVWGVCDVCMTLFRLLRIGFQSRVAHRPEESNVHHAVAASGSRLRRPTRPSGLTAAATARASDGHAADGGGGCSVESETRQGGSKESKRQPHPGGSRFAWRQQEGRGQCCAALAGAWSFAR